MGVHTETVTTNNRDEAMTNILLLTRKGEGYVGAPQTRHEFEQELTKHCNCVFAGEGWPLYRAEEPMDVTVTRVMPDADWVIDRDNDLHNKKPPNRRYKVGLFISDLHGKHHYGVKTPTGFTDMINAAGYDRVWMRYPRIYGTSHSSDVVYKGLEAETQWVPWSVSPDKFRRHTPKWDVSFIGSRGHCYPLRNDVWENIHGVARGYKVLRREAPKGKTFTRDVKSLTSSYVVGENYAKTLGESRMLLFGCSIYRYATQKFFEAPACHCLVVSNKPGMAEQLGFVDGKTYVEVSTENWKKRLLYLLENPSYVQRVARAGMKNVLMNHSHEKRVKEWLKKLEA